MLKHLWFAGAKRPATPLQFHVAIGGEIAAVHRMDLHLILTSEGKLFVKPIPPFLLDLAFCNINLHLQCPNSCACQGTPRKVALGFLYTYASPISSEADFHIANDKRLLPSRKDGTPIHWTDWKISYLRAHRNYGSLFRDNIAWVTASTVYVALVLTAMQVGLATEQLQGNTTFQRASYGFTVFAILGAYLRVWPGGVVGGFHSC
ncbi:hypothetical protein B0T17DRAFT_616338 [Bombardia bombarda]|uniref:Uncharacterized protein n=1 Tax=Bombardia bombarda TaxID=252184 RepID=A0AA39XB73_9PEZI|nr:hypothetical protein B0T17DRAFT_616338 [Bombardia bombarda]